MVGIDVSIIDFFIVSNNESFAAPKYLIKAEEKNQVNTKESVYNQERL